MLNTRDGLFTLGRLRGEMDRLFSDLFEPQRGGGWWGEREGLPLNLWEDANHFYVEAELPGFKLEDIEILVVKNELSLRGERKAATENDRTYHRRERSSGPFNRVIRLPAEVAADKVEATLRNGVLQIQLPKAEEAKPRKIQVLAK